MTYRLSQIKAVLAAVKKQGISMQKKLFFYFASLICGFLAVVIIILNFAGILNPTNKTFQRLLSAQSEVSLSYIKHNTAKLSANAVSFSQKLSTDIKKTLQINAMSFDDLGNNPTALKAVQSNTYNTVYTYMQLTPASGAFYYLNTTTKPEKGSYSGIYLKFKNLSTENTINTDISMYHGISSVARENKISLNSTWTLETEKGLFREIDEMMEQKNMKTAQEGVMTSLYQLPGTWEHAFFVCAPIVNDKKEIIGVCGFEINSLYFKYIYKNSVSDTEHMVLTVFDETDDSYSGIISEYTAASIISAEGNFKYVPNTPFDLFRINDEKYIGKTQNFSVGESNHYSAVMLPYSYYRYSKYKTQLLIFVIFLLITAAAIICCSVLSRRYINPIINDIEGLKQGTINKQNLRIPEIVDLLDFLEQNDRDYEQKLSSLEEQKRLAEQEAARIQSELDRIIDKRKKELSDDGVNHFMQNLITLTPREKDVFNLYLEGYSGKEIVEKLGFTNNALKFHNKNIYSKLGVTSRKELMQYAVILKRKNNNI
ncbi:response regulator transcription factor [Acetivibrio sp. MSJd-27]|uniref:response regulator transcription factor n=1 Tax=Acetivibrio sp. MSJd-27 TaxID=2841523 RepID=UPI001C118FA2|nr:LuxR C-terminal-related transcriptional regulator [Acetivibrio sp. MSJd-27]MBU5451205.1 LuxR C-terminal-related transcriptional regulator [Acetivibrio sp. MSJd-27]